MSRVASFITGSVLVALVGILIFGLIRIGSAANDANYKITVFQGCEYFQCPVYLGIVLSHKGNCTNSIHWRNEK